MAFDDKTRVRLQRFVTDARTVLSAEFAKQFQEDYGLDPASGAIADLDSLSHLDDRRLEIARILREIASHYLASAADRGEGAQKAVLDRMVREQAFTALNRLAALRMMEARSLLMDAVAEGYTSKAFKLYQRVAGSALGETGDAYRVFLHSMFDVYALDLPALFDRYAPNGRLFPREQALLAVLDLINAHDIAPLWAEDETIGWIYQYFNSKEERKAMRDASQAPRNSRELAVRNQFFTPRYVVEFLVDNTLGRLWFNWTGGQTALRDRCEYLLVKPDEAPEPLRRPRDPRTIKLLDPACGSMHFGLYAFDLVQEIYREAWEWEQTHGAGSLDTETGGGPDLKPLSHTYADQNSFLRDVPRLIIERNIYGVDIDPRAAQIASLALWLRAQRAWHDAGVKAEDRPQIGRGQVVAAVAPPAEVELRKRFMQDLEPLDAELFEQTLFMLKGLPELGVLLQVEKELPALVRKLFGEHGDLFREDDLAQWQKAETRLREALTDYARAARSTYQGRLFAEDALQGLRMIDHCREVFDVVVMNPPFGEFSESQRDFARDTFTSGSHDILTAFVEVAIAKLKQNGLLGAITSRTSFFAPTTTSWREEVILEHQLRAWIDLGDGVLDDAMVETCAYVVENCPETDCAVFLSANESSLLEAAKCFRLNMETEEKFYSVRPRTFSKTKGSPFAYWLEPELLQVSNSFSSLDNSGVKVAVGLQTGDDFRFIRCWWEIANWNDDWLLHAKGGENEPFATDVHLLVNWRAAGKEIKSQSSVRLNAYSKTEPSSGLPPGLTFPYRTHRFSPALMPKDTITGVAGMGIFSDHLKLPTLVSILNSSVFNELVDVRLGLREINALYQAGVISPVPFPTMTHAQSEELASLGVSAWLCASLRQLLREEALRFSGFFFDRKGLAASADVINSEWEDCLHQLMSSFEKIDKLVGGAYGLSQITSDRIHQRNLPLFRKSFPDIATSLEAEAEKLASLALATKFGRYSAADLRFVVPVSQEQEPYLSDVLDSVNFKRPQKYGPDCSSVEELAAVLHDYLCTVFETPNEAHHEFLIATNHRSIESYINDPNGFFASHLKRFSKSRRKAPIYWPLSTASGSYTLWLYYPNLTSQTLYSAINDFIEPKLKQVAREAAALREKGSARTRDDDKALGAFQDLEHELNELREALLRIAPNWKPNHDDGVQITAAPLYELFRHRPWQTVLKDTWAKLNKGDYDWAHLAMAYWPARVREKCKTDKSLAIAHDLEDLYVAPEPKTGGRKKKGSKA